MTAPLNLDALEAAARAATPGPWQWDGDTLMAGKDYLLWPNNVLNPVDGIELTWAERLGSCGETTEPRAEANAQLIAAANPATVLALIERLRAAEASEEHYRKLAGELRKQQMAAAERDICKRAAILMKDAKEAGLQVKMNGESAVIAAMPVEVPNAHS